MSPQPIDFALIIPAYCEQDRLPDFLCELIPALAEEPFRTLIQIVDDGSPADSRQKLLAAVEPLSVGASSVSIGSVLVLPTHAGKGQAIRSGWSNAPEATWLAFVDADGAIPASEVHRVLSEIWQTPAASEVGCYITTRSAENHRAQRRWPRALASHVFAALTGALFHTGFRDTQCGFKVVRQSIWRTLQPHCHEKGFCFDLELLVLVQNLPAPIREIPIAWHEKKSGHFHLLRDTFPVLLHTLRLRLRINQSKRSSFLAMT